MKVIKFSKKPVIISCYGYDVSSFPKKYWGFGRHYVFPVFNHVDLVLAMTQDMKKDILKLGCPEEKILVHYAGTDCRRFANPTREYLSKEKVKILYCGRLTEKKGLIYVLKALIEIQDRNSIELHVVGDGELRDSLLEFVIQNKLLKSVIFHGHIKHSDSKLVEHYIQADIFILPSIIAINGNKEGIPGTIVEAMASALPIISTYHGGIPEVIKNEVNGLLVLERNISLIAQAIKRLAGDIDLRRRLGQAAYNTATLDLDLETNTLALEVIYSNLLAKKNGKDKSIQDKGIAR